LIGVTQEPWCRLTLMKVTATDANIERLECPRLLDEDATHRIIKLLSGVRRTWLRLSRVRVSTALFWELSYEGLEVASEAHIDDWYRTRKIAALVVPHARQFRRTTRRLHMLGLTFLGRSR
jgi:hypothetical protein